jgi:hypothetical protein
LIRQEKMVDTDLGRAARGAILVGFALLVLACLGAIVVALAGAKAEQAATHSLQVRGAQELLFSTVFGALSLTVRNSKARYSISQLTPETPCRTVVA